VVKYQYGNGATGTLSAPAGQGESQDLSADVKKFQIITIDGHENQAHSPWVSVS
jgi:hypothetical protein